MAKTVSVLDMYLGISSNSQEGAVLRLLIELGAQVVGAEEGSLLVLDEKRQELVFAMTVGNASSEKAQRTVRTVDRGTSGATPIRSQDVAQGTLGLNAGPRCSSAQIFVRIPL